MNIPEQVKEAADGLGTGIGYLGKYSGKDVYSIEFGESEDTGMPALVLFDGKKATLKIDTESLHILHVLTAS